MKRLRELWFIRTKPGASGEFHYVLLMNPNAAMEWMRTASLMQDVLYSRLIERIADVGAYGEIEAIREYWKVQKAAEAAAATAATQATAVKAS